MSTMLAFSVEGTGAASLGGRAHLLVSWCHRVNGWCSWDGFQCSSVTATGPEHCIQRELAVLPRRLPQPSAGRPVTPKTTCWPKYCNDHYRHQCGPLRPRGSHPSASLSVGPTRVYLEDCHPHLPAPVLEADCRSPPALWDTALYWPVF